MSRRNQKSRHKPSAPSLHSAGTKELALKAFRSSNFGEAIRLWNESGAADNPAVRAAVAEAHFRRTLMPHSTVTDPAAELRRALALMPDEARYWYHLGLILHRANNIQEARHAYARAADLGLSRRGSHFARGLAELEADPALALSTLPWLSPEVRAGLEPIAALLQGRHQDAVTQTTPNSALTPPISGDPVASLWRGLALLAMDDAEAAGETLRPPKGQHLPLGVESIRAFYYGLALARSGKPQAALASWKEILRVGAEAKAFSLSHLNACISQASAQNMLALQNAGQWEEALRQAQAGLSLLPEDRWLLQAALIAANRLAEAAREGGKWSEAASRWQTMRGLLETHPGTGALAPVLHNLAVAYEKIEAWEPAAQAWAALLSTMPRRGGRAAKKPAATPNTLSADEQRAWLRLRILDDYKRAGLPDEAISYYKLAVKGDPDNLELRLELAAALFANEQEIAARNEVKRILDKDAKHVGALLLQAEIHEARDDVEAAEQSLRRILESDPKNDKALRGIGQLLLERGMDAFNFGQFAQARHIYTEALKYAPEDVQLRVFLGETEIEMGHVKAGQAHFETALATGNPRAYVQVFTHWAARQNEAEARNLLARAETAQAASPQLRIDLGIVCLTRAVSPPPFTLRREPSKPQFPALWQKWGRELIEQGLDAAPDRAEMLEHLIATLGPLQPKIAIEYNQQLVALTPNEPEPYLSLGLFQGMNGDAVGARKTLVQAERLARKQGKQDLVAEITQLRGEINSPLFGMLGSLLASGGPNPFGSLDLE